jgi:hypothetical protein
MLISLEGFLPLNSLMLRGGRRNCFMLPELPVVRASVDETDAASAVTLGDLP